MHFSAFCGRYVPPLPVAALAAAVQIDFRFALQASTVAPHTAAPAAHSVSALPSQNESALGYLSVTVSSPHAITKTALLKPRKQSVLRVLRIMREVFSQAALAS